jgi:hypothetical protein
MRRGAFSKGVFKDQESGGGGGSGSVSDGGVIYSHVLHLADDGEKGIVLLLGMELLYSLSIIEMGFMKEIRKPIRSKYT